LLRRIGTHLAALCDGPFFAIKNAYGSNAMFPELVDEAIPSQDVPVLVRHGRKVKTLRDESAIAKKEDMVRWGAGVQGRISAIYITKVLLERDLRRLGSCLMTCGLVR
jgi:hypothetical protein